MLNPEATPCIPASCTGKTEKSPTPKDKVTEAEEKRLCLPRNEPGPTAFRGEHSTNALVPRLDGDTFIKVLINTATKSLVVPVAG